MAQLSRLGFRTAAMALSDDSVSIDDRRLMAEEKLAVILGSEGDGLTETTIARCDYTVKIPMYHGGPRWAGSSLRSEVTARAPSGFAGSR